MKPDDLPGHRYLNNHRPDWRKSLETIQEQGGPWYCTVCETASMLCYRCSKCGAELSDNAATHGRQG